MEDSEHLSLKEIAERSVKIKEFYFIKSNYNTAWAKALLGSDLERPLLLEEFRIWKKKWEDVADYEFD